MKFITSVLKEIAELELLDKGVLTSQKYIWIQETKRVFTPSEKEYISNTINATASMKVSWNKDTLVIHLPRYDVPYKKLPIDTTGLFYTDFIRLGTKA